MQIAGTLPIVIGAIYPPVIVIDGGSTNKTFAAPKGLQANVL
jgi:hypothetical protein